RPVTLAIRLGTSALTLLFSAGPLALRRLACPALLGRALFGCLITRPGLLRVLLGRRGLFRRIHLRRLTRLSLPGGRACRCRGSLPTIAAGGRLVRTGLELLGDTYGGLATSGPAEGPHPGIPEGAKAGSVQSLLKVYRSLGTFRLHQPGLIGGRDRDGVQV